MLRKDTWGCGAQASFQMSSVTTSEHVLDLREAPAVFPPASTTLSLSSSSCHLFLPLFFFPPPESLQQAFKSPNIPLTVSLTLGTNNRAVVGCHGTLVKTSWLVEGLVAFSRDRKENAQKALGRAGHLPWWGARLKQVSGYHLGVTESLGSGVRWPNFKSHLCHFLGVWTWGKVFNFPEQNFLI